MLNVAYNQNLGNGIDASALKDVTKQIFQRAAAKSSTTRTQSAATTFDFSKFKRADLGLDLYNGNVDSQTAKQVALTNSGLQVKLSQKAVSSLAYLNNVASKASTQNVNAQTVPAVKEETVQEKKVLQFPKFNTLIQTLNTGHDKNGSNPFYPGAIATKGKKKSVEEKQEVMDLIA